MLNQKLNEKYNEPDEARSTIGCHNLYQAAYSEGNNVYYMPLFNQQ